MKNGLSLHTFTLYFIHGVFVQILDVIASNRDNVFFFLKSGSVPRLQAVGALCKNIYLPIFQINLGTNISKPP